MDTPRRELIEATKKEIESLEQQLRLKRGLLNYLLGEEEHGRDGTDPRRHD